MMSPFIDITTLLHQKATLQSKISILTPGQFQLLDRYESQLACLIDQINDLQQPSMVNIHHYTPTDVDFIQTSKSKSKSKGKAIVNISESIQKTSTESES